MRGEDVIVPVTGDRSIRGYLACPDTDGPSPGVLVLHEMLGLNDDIRRIAGRFADEGYVALAPDIFDGRGPMPVCIVRVMSQLMRGRGDAIEDMRLARDWLAEQPDVDASRIGVAGFCMGGGFALLLAAIGDFRVAAPFYGDVREDVNRYRDICPVVGGWGGRDKMFASKAPLLQRHLETLGVTHDIVVYDDAGHSFMSNHPQWMSALAPYTPLRAGYNEAAAEDSWRRVLSFFGEHMA